MNHITKLLIILLTASIIPVFAQPSPSQKVKKTISFLYADQDDDNKRDIGEPVLVMTASDYEKTFKERPPLSRMLREQIKLARKPLEACIVLNSAEIKKLDKNNDQVLTNADKDSQGKSHLPKIFLVKVDTQTQDAFIATGVNLADKDALKSIVLNTNTSNKQQNDQEHELHSESGGQTTLRTDIKTKPDDMPGMGL